MVLSSPPCQRAGPQASVACAAGAGEVTTSSPAPTSTWPPCAGDALTATALRLASCQVPAPSAGSRTRACRRCTVARQDESASAALGPLRPPSSASCRSSWRAPWVSCPCASMRACASVPSMPSLSWRASIGGASVAVVTDRRGAVRLACSSGFCQPPCQRACSVALPRASASASASATPGQRRSQARVRAASVSLTCAVPAPRVACSSPCTVAPRPGAVVVMSARPPGVAVPRPCSVALPASCASSVRMRNCSSVSTLSAQRPRACRSCRRSARSSRSARPGVPLSCGAVVRAPARACSVASKSMASPAPCTVA